MFVKQTKQTENMFLIYPPKNKRLEIPCESLGSIWKGQ